MPRQIYTQTDAVVKVTGNVDSTEIVLCDDDVVKSCDGFTLFLDITKDSEAAKVFTAAATDLCTTVAHGFATGRKGQVSTTTTLPAGLSAVTDYFVVKISDDTYKLASSYANAIASPPVVIDITDAGTGVQTFTPTALAGASWQLKVSPDSSGSVWYDYAAATNITATAKSIAVEKLNPKYKRLKVSYLMTAGQISLSQKVVADVIVQDDLTNS